MNKLVLLGTAESVFKPDYADKETDIWAIGSCFGKKIIRNIPRINAGFEIHDSQKLKLIIEQKDYDFKLMKCPVYVQNPNDEFIKSIVPKPVEFPFDDVVKFTEDFWVMPGRKYELTEIGYFNCSFSWMLSFAVMMGYKDISFYGVLLSSGGEYFLERPGIEYLIVKHIIRDGITVHFPEDCELFSPTEQYGRKDRANCYKIKSYQKHLYGKMYNEFKNIEAYTAAINKNLGAIEVIKLLRSGKG